MPRLVPLVIAALFILASCRGSEPGTSTIPIQGAARAQAAATMWTMPDAWRLKPNSAAMSGAQRISLAAARNETVSLQIAVRAPQGGLTGVTLLPATFTSARHHPVPATLYREYFINIPHASPIDGRPRSLGAGIYPDGLIPFLDPSTRKAPSPARLRAGPISLAAGAIAAYWIDVHVPTGTTPGDYTATFEVRSDQGSFHVSVPLHVWRFTMPVAPSLDSSFNVYPSAAVDDDGISTDSELLSERIQMNPIVPAYERKLEPLGLKMVELGVWSGADYSHCTMSPPPSASYVAHLAARNSIKYILDQPADEIGHCKNLDSTLVPIIQRYAREFHAANVLSLITMAPVPALESDGSGTGRSAVDIWTMQPPEYDANVPEVRKVLAKGDRAWFYTDLSPDTYSPKWAVDAPPADYRIPALIDESLGLTGELYWAVNKWRPNAWDDVEYPDGGGVFSAGEGILTYPGTDVGITGLAPSMRLKWIRDGMYDADEVALLKACGRGAWALAQVRTIAKDWHTWTLDAARIDAMHLKLAKEIDGNCAGKS
jgi:hypothetical protein